MIIIKYTHNEFGVQIITAKIYFTIDQIKSIIYINLLLFK